MHSVTIYQYAGTLLAIEFGPKDAQPKNFVIVIAGLGDGLLAVPYVPPLAEKLPQNWTLVQPLITSSYTGYGLSSLEKDARELGLLVKFLRTQRGSEDSKVVLMGHSTGCQDTMEYLTKHSHKDNFDSILAIDAGVLQAPVSDSEGLALADTGSELKDLLQLAQKHISDGKPNELLPAAALKYTFGAPITAYRFNSLVSERGDDDYFSSYLNEEDWKVTFGRVTKPLLVLYGGKDEFAPESLDKQKLIDSWKGACRPGVWSKYSKVVPGATHKVDEQSDAGAAECLIESVVNFIKDEF